MLENENIFYTYVYLDPRQPGNYNYGEFHFDYEPFYIGKGHKDRLYNHLYESKQKEDCNAYKINKIRKIIALGFDLKNGFIIKIKENMLEKDSIDLEILMIKIIGRHDLGLGPLLNLTDGGEGLSGHKHSKETKEKISKAHLGHKVSDEAKEKMSKAKKGIKQSEEIIKKRAAGRIGIPLTEEHKLNLSIAHKKTNESLKELGIIRKPHLGKHHSEETKEKLSQFFKGKVLKRKEKFNDPNLKPGIVPLGNQKYVFVDIEDYEKVMKYNWHLNGRKIGAVEAVINKKRIRLHRFVLNIEDDKLVYFIDNNFLNCKKENLKIGKIKSSKRNGKFKIRPNKKNKYRGVSLRFNKWKSRIMLNQKEIFLGSFNTEIEAAKAYDEAAIKYFGEFACLNFPEQIETEKAINEKNIY